MATYRFDEIAINSTKKKKPTEEDKVHYIGLEHIDPGCFNIVRWGSDVAPTGDKLLMQKGDVLFGKRRAYQRKVGIAPFDGIFSAHGMVLRPNTEIIDANYFPFFISSDRFMETAVRISVGGLSPTINWKDLAKQKFDLPTLEEQKVLADKLWAAYRLKEGYKKLLAATDEMVKSQFIEMYHKTHNTQTLESVCAIISKGITPKYVDFSSVAVVNQACIQWDGQHLENIKYHNEEILFKKRTLQTGDVLLNATGTGTLGRCCVFNCPSNDNIYINDGHVIALATDKSILLPEVLNAYLSLNDTQAEIYRLYVTGSTNQVDIVFSDIKKMKVPVPNIDDQISFVRILNQADKSKFGDFKSQFIEMFGDCVNRIKLSSLCSTFVDGDWIESKDQSELGIRLIQTGNVGNGFFKDKEDKSRYISEETFDNLHCTEIYPGDILVSRLPDPIGRACIIPQGLGRTITAVDCTIIRLKDIILPDYFIAYTMTPSYVAQINEVTTGTTRRRVSRANLGNILIPCPSIAKQQQFVAIAKQADKSKSYVRIVLKNLESMLGYYKASSLVK